MKLDLFKKSLRVGFPISGVELGDTIIRLSSWEKKGWKISGLRIPPGILSQGSVLRKDDFVQALVNLKKQTGLNYKIPIVLSLGAVKIFTQVISLPILEEDKLEEALELNMRMISPIPYDQAYSNSQFIRRDEDSGKVEFLAAFVEKTLVDDIVNCFSAAGFLVIVVEPKSLSLARVMKKSTFEHNRSYILTHIDANGVEYMVMRNGNLYFDYFNSWKELEAENRELSLDDFQRILVRGLNQVLNFYNSHWPEPMDSIILSTEGMWEDIQQIIQSNFPYKVYPLKINIAENVGSEWLVSLGAAIRGFVSRKQDMEISLLGIGARDEYRREQILVFAKFWRTLAPLTMGIAIFVLASFSFFLRAEWNRIMETPPFKLMPEQTTEVMILQERARTFNSKVSAMLAIQEQYKPKVSLLKKLKPITDQHEITITKLAYGKDNLVSLSGTSKSNESILVFRDTMTSNNNFRNVDLPFTNIQTTPNGFIFSMTFTFIPSKLE